jgi:bifunctional DNA-binding transcriptional regulator/antitoxin component of YhaV-PrlF toxin-antitoxin module
MNQLNEDQSWTLHVDEDGVLTLPDELWQALDWGEGDGIEFLEQEDGSILLVKADQQEVDVDAEEVIDG